jgi:hypothetical protein
MEDANCTAIVPAISTGGGVAVLGVHPTITAKAKKTVKTIYKMRDLIFFSDSTKVKRILPHSQRHL